MSKQDEVRKAYYKSFSIEAEKQYLVHNRTPNRIWIEDPEFGDMCLPPLARRQFDGERLEPFAGHLIALRQRHQVRVREITATRGSLFGRFAIWLVMLALLGVFAFDLLVCGTLRRTEAIVTASLVGIVVLVALVLAAQRERKRIAAARVADSEEGDVELGIGDAWYDGNDTGRHLKYLTILALVIVVGAVLPAVAVFVATDGKAFLTMGGGLSLNGGLESRFVSRAIQVIYTAVLSLFPALMYFQFDRQRVSTIRGGWVRAIFRMDPQMETLADVDARYGDRLGEASGFSTDSSRLLGGRYSPIVVATILISLGWVLLVLPTKSYDFEANRTRDAAAVAAPAQDAEDPVELSLFELIDATPSAATMAFLGAYFFAVYLVLRGYSRGDLRPKIYNQITARLVTVVVMAYLINVLLKPAGAVENGWWAVAFLAGVVPITVLQRLGLLVSATLGNLPGWTGFLKTGFANAFATPRALTQIDGIDMYESVRLESEGITDIPTLATTDLVSMMVDTRLPVERLIDWSDQAMLMMLVPEPDEGLDDSGDGTGETAARGEAGKPASRVKALQHVGIRTASSVLAAAYASKDSGLHKQATSVLGEDLLESLAQQIANEPSTQRICHWRETEQKDLCEPRPVIRIPPEPTAVRSGLTFYDDVATMVEDGLVIIDMRDFPDRQDR
ncbi:MAG TPA: hypothetical protein VFB94_06255 [Acidimicrobiales bacterium]|nr:hypothetical protein [Acidimicrobiales bacterium]